MAAVWPDLPQRAGGTSQEKARSAIPPTFFTTMISAPLWPGAGKIKTASRWCPPLVARSTPAGATSAPSRARTATASSNLIPSSPTEWVQRLLPGRHNGEPEANGQNQPRAGHHTHLMPPHSPGFRGTTLDEVVDWSEHQPGVDTEEKRLHEAQYEASGAQPREARKHPFEELRRVQPFRSDQPIQHAEYVCHSRVEPERPRHHLDAEWMHNALSFTRPVSAYDRRFLIPCFRRRGLSDHERHDLFTVVGPSPGITSRARSGTPPRPRPRRSGRASRWPRHPESPPGSRGHSNNSGRNR